MYQLDLCYSKLNFLSILVSKILWKNINNNKKTLIRFLGKWNFLVFFKILHKKPNYNSKRKYTIFIYKAVFFDSEFLENIFFQFSQELGLEIAKRSLISASAWKFIRSSDWLWHHPIRSQKRLSTAAVEFCYNKLKKVIKLTFSEFFIAYFYMYNWL